MEAGRVTAPYGRTGCTSPRVWQCAAPDRGWAEPTKLRRALAGLPVPRAADGRIVLVVNVSNGLRPDAPASDERLFCHVYGRGDCKLDQVVSSWPHSFVAALEAGRTSRWPPAGRGAAWPRRRRDCCYRYQLREVVVRLVKARDWQPGDPEVLIMKSSGYDVAYLSHALASLPVGRLRSDCVVLRGSGPAHSAGWRSALRRKRRPVCVRQSTQVRAL